MGIEMLVLPRWAAAAPAISEQSADNDPTHTNSELQ